VCTYISAGLQLCKVYDKAMYVLDGTPKGRNPTKIYVCMYIVQDGTAKIP
jgi:hypothetical protein